LATEIAKLSLEGIGIDEEIDWPMVQRACRELPVAAVYNKFAKASTEASNTVQNAISPILNVVCGYAKEEVPSQLLQKFVDLAKSKNAYPVVVIDEANGVLGTGKDDTEKILKELVSRTKQTMQMSLILASSEHAYPYQL
jgi:hypothetical protein